MSANNRHGFDSPEQLAQSRALRTRLFCVHGLLWRAVRGAARLAGSSCRSVNPHGSAYPFDSGKAENATAQLESIMPKKSTPLDQLLPPLAAESLRTYGEYMLHIVGDALLPTFRDGDTVIIDPKIAPEPERITGVAQTPITLDEYPKWIIGARISPLSTGTDGSNCPQRLAMLRIEWHDPRMALRLSRLHGLETSNEPSFPHPTGRVSRGRLPDAGSDSTGQSNGVLRPRHLPGQTPTRHERAR